MKNIWTFPNDVLHGQLAPEYGDPTEDGEGYFFTCEGLEKLARAILELPVVVGSDPVAWRYRYPIETSGWTVILSKARADHLRETGYIVDPLFTNESMVRGKS